jgi:DNA replication protein DnaC
MHAGQLTVVDCDCVKIITRQLNLLQANIPRQYWDLEIMPEFVRSNKAALVKVEKYVAALKHNVEAGRGLWMHSPPGLGKSTCICTILKRGIKLGLRVYFTKSSHMVRNKFAALKDRKAQQLVDYIIEDVDLLAVEELEKVYLGSDESFNNQLFYEFLADVYDRKKALLVSSNASPDEVLSKLPTFIGDRLRLLDAIQFRGVTVRKILKERRNGKLA